MIALGHMTNFTMDNLEYRNVFIGAVNHMIKDDL